MNPELEALYLKLSVYEAMHRADNSISAEQVQAVRREILQWKRDNYLANDLNIE